MKNSKLKEIESSLIEHIWDKKVFGLLCVMGYHDPDTDSDIDEYLLCTAKITEDKEHRYGKSVAIGNGLWIYKDKEVVITANEIVEVFGIFRKYGKELICDLYSNVDSFDVSRYIERIKRLDAIPVNSKLNKEQEELRILTNEANKCYENSEMSLMAIRMDVLKELWKSTKGWNSIIPNIKVANQISKMVKEERKRVKRGMRNDS